MLPDDQPNPPDEDDDDDDEWKDLEDDCHAANLEEGSDEELDYLAVMEKKGYFQ